MFELMLSRSQLFLLLAIASFMALIALPVTISAQNSAKAIPSYYPTQYDGKGTIDRIDSDETVIGDIEYDLVRRPVFNTPQMRDSSGYSFEEGSFVGFLLNDDNEIISLWLINDYVDYRKE
jgi:hypothetical protein